jgi:hypothetical protein
MAWDGPILTDSGGFQVFSLDGLRRRSTEEGVEFQSHLDGSRRFFTPERVMQIERILGADVIMQFDNVVPGQSEGRPGTRGDGAERALARALRRGVRAARGAQTTRDDRCCSPIVQGGSTRSSGASRRERSRRCTTGPGYGIGGLSVGEAKPDMYAMLDVVDDALPDARPRYLMGVGFPRTWSRGAPRRGPVRLRGARRAWGGTGSVHRRGAPQHQAHRVPAGTAAARHGVRGVARAGASRGRTCGTCSRATRCWGRAFSPCTMYISWSP